MGGSQVDTPRSFGRRREDPAPSELPVVLPPIQLSPVQVPLVLVVDAAALAEVSAQISQMVTAAVMSGFGEAMCRIELATAEAAAGEELGGKPPL